MKRRGFIGTLIGAVFGSTAIAKVAPDNSVRWFTEAERERNDGFMSLRIEGTYRGYGLMWTGWKEAQHSIEVVSQWVAYHLDGDKRLQYGGCMYASFPGAEGRLSRGLSFDICTYSHQAELAPDPMWFLNEATREKAKSVTLHRLLDLIDKEGLR